MITVLTSITGGKDNIIHDHVKGDAKWIAYTDFPFESDLWERRPAYDRFLSPRRNSRVPKILSHQFSDTRYSVWIDGNLKLLVPPEDLLKYVENHDIAMFKHPTRDCVYAEGEVCMEGRLDNPEIIKNQLETYRKSGYGENKGLCECGVIIRRHTDKVKQFNNAWWSEYCTHSVRDQISMMYALNEVGLTINQVDLQFQPEGNRMIRGGIVEYVNHLTPRHEDITRI